MPNEAEDITRHVFQSTDGLLLDTNVWFYIYGPPRKPGHQKTAIYSDAFARILAAKSQIIIDVLIISEFMNAYARLRHNVLRSNPDVPRSFKLFRRSETFKPIAQDIAADTKYILQHCHRVESGFDAVDINALVAEFAEGDSDFNDQVLAELCRSRGLKLVTDDGDFKGTDLTILTANPRLLS